MPLSFRLLAALIAFASVPFLCPVKAHAQAQLSRDSSAQTHENRLQPIPTLQDYQTPGTIPSLGDILKNVHGSYSVSYMGPRLTGDSDETYNIYLPDKAPVQLYHTLKLGYQVSPDLQIGFDESIVNNLADGVQGFSFDSHGNSVFPRSYGKTFDWYDPDVYFDLPNLMSVPGWFVSTSASFSLPLTQSSLNVKRITQLIIQQSWTKSSEVSSKWSWGFNLYLNPQFYNDPIPDGFTTRKTLSFSFGPNFGYQVSDLFSLSAAATFDVQHDSPDDQGFFHLGEGLPDYFQIKATVFPSITPLWMTVGFYFQSLTWNPSWDTSIMGANFSIGF